MNKSLLFLSVLSLLQLPAEAQNSFYGHDRSWGHGRVVGGSTVPNDYLIPTAGTGEITRSTPPFGSYRTGTASSTDGKFVNGNDAAAALLAERRAQQLRQQRQKLLYQQAQQQSQMQARLRQQTQPQQPQGYYYVPGQNSGAGQTYSYDSYTSSGAATYSQPVHQNSSYQTSATRKR